MSMPALPQACLTIAWFFWRGALIEVWSAILGRLPILTPDALRPSLPTGPVKELVGLLPNVHVPDKRPTDVDLLTIDQLRAPGLRAMGRQP